MSDRRKKISEVAKQISLSDSDTMSLFDYLDRLRDSGITNMFGAAPYIQAYNEQLDRTKAIVVLKGWIESYGK